MHCRLLTAALVALGLVTVAAGVGATDSTDPPTTALLIIDVQQFYFASEGGKVPLVEPEAAGRQAGRLLAAFRELGWPVIHVQHLPKGQDAPDPTGPDPQYRIHASVFPAAGETVIGKHHANAFRDTDLLSTLRELGVSRLVITGMQTHMCVEAATRAAADLGFDVVVVHDACATRALEFGGAEVPAVQVHAAALAAMSGTYARVVSTDELVEELGVAKGPE